MYQLFRNLNLRYQFHSIWLFLYLTFVFTFAEKNETAFFCTYAKYTFLHERQPNHNMLVVIFLRSLRIQAYP